MMRYYRRFTALLASVLLTGLLSACSVPANLAGSWDVTFANEVNETSHALSFELSQPFDAYTGRTRKVAGDVLLDGEVVGHSQGSVSGASFDLVVEFTQQVEGATLSLQGVLEEPGVLRGTYESSDSGRGSIEGRRTN